MVWNFRFGVCRVLGFRVFWASGFKVLGFRVAGFGLGSEGVSSGFTDAHPTDDLVCRPL